MNRGDWARRPGWAAILLLAGTPEWLACAGDSASIDEASGDTSSGNSASGNRAGELARVEARVDVIASGADVGDTFTPLVDSFIADGTGLYWYDGRGAVFARRSSDPEVVELRPALERPSRESLLELVIGMADDDERLFVGQAFLQTGATDYFPVPDFQPPGRLLVIPKNGDPARVVVELADATITPIASDATRVIVHVQGTNGGFYQLIRSSLELEPLPLRAPFYSSLRSGDTLYWSNDEYPPSLLRARFDDAEPERVASMERTELDVGPGYALTRQERLLEPDFVVAQNFVLHEAATGDERPLPGMGETISLETALDARHAYWFSYRGEGPGMLPLTKPLFRLVRVDIESGALTLLNTPGFRLDPGARMIGQTADHLYLANAGELLAIEKP